MRRECQLVYIRSNNAPFFITIDSTKVVLTLAVAAKIFRRTPAPVTRAKRGAHAAMLTRVVAAHIIL